MHYRIGSFVCLYILNLFVIYSHDKIEFSEQMVI